MCGQVAQLVEHGVDGLSPMLDANPRAGVDVHGLVHLQLRSQALVNGKACIGKGVWHKTFPKSICGWRKPIRRGPPLQEQPKEQLKLFYEPVISWLWF